MEVRSEPSFTMSMPKNLIVSQPSISGMRLTVTPDGTAVYKPISPIRSNSAPAFQDGSSPATLHGINLGSSGELVKKKRGRPRKYGHEGNMGLGLTSISSPSSAVVPPPGFSPLQPKSDLSAFDPTKKARGRPPGSLNKQKMLSLGSVGTGFTPHVITVKAGEDVSSKIMSFSQHGSRSICVLSANGAISNVTLRQAATSGGTVTYEGRFEILSLSGSFMISDNGGQRSRTGGLSVSLAGPDGRVLGGGVAGLLTAASPVQVVVGSFVADAITKELNHINHFDGLMGVGKLAVSGNMYGGGVTIGGGNSPPSRGTLSGSSGGPPSPLNQGIVACNNNSQQGMPTISWK